MGVPLSQRVKKASQSLPHLRQIKSNLFCGGACTRRKIQYRTQVCSLSASSGQRASPKGISVGHAQCPARDFVEKPNRFFDRLRAALRGSSAYPIIRKLRFSIQGNWHSLPSDSKVNRPQKRLAWNTLTATGFAGGCVFMPKIKKQKNRGREINLYPQIYCFRIGNA